MKTINVLMLLLLSSACQQMAQESDQQEEVVYELFKITGQIKGSETTHLAYQETYLLKPDRRFIRTRTQKGNQLKLEGTYEWQREGDETHLVLTYSEDSPLIGNCSGSLQESFYLNQNHRLQNNWMACDGPGLYYKKKS